VIQNHVLIFIHQSLYRGWLPFILPLLLVMMAAYMASVRNMRNGAAIKEVVVPMPPNQNTVEQLLALQQALSQLEGLIQAGNIFLLKTRALFLSALPEVSTLLYTPPLWNRIVVHRASPICIVTTSASLIWIIVGH